MRPAHIYEIKRWLKTRFEKLSVRARNCIPEAYVPAYVCELANATKGSVDLLSIKNCGTKTLAEIRDFIDDFNCKLKEILDKSEIGTNINDENELLTYELFDLYPFLTLDECREMAEFSNRTGNIPFLHIARRYVEIERGTDRNIEIIVRRYALGRAHGESMDRLAETFNMTRERVRQIIGKGISLPDKLERELEAKVASRLKPINSFDEPIWQELCDKYAIRCTSRDVAVLVGAVLSDYTIVQIEAGDTEYLVRRELLKNSTLKTAFSKLKLALVQRRTENEEFSIADFMCDSNKKYHPDYVLLGGIIATYIRRNFGFEVIDDNIIKATANKIDNFEAMERVLLEHGQPMTAHEMWNMFRRMYPDAGVKKYTSFKAYLVMNPRILARGKTGTYAHCDWDHYFVGSVSDFVAHTIISQGRRVTIAELCELIRHEYGDMSRNNLVATLRMDHSREYVVYDDDSVGIRGVLTDNEGVNERRVSHRIPFEQRLQKLELFIKAYDRMPYSSDNEEESALSRWIYNMNHHKIDASPEQYIQFREFMNCHSSLPHSRIEYKLREKCKEIISLLSSDEGHSHDLSSQEKAWIRKTLRNRQKFAENDQRARYVEELEAFLTKAGYDI